MPTILRLLGYRIGFYSGDLDEPVHVHITKAGCEAKYWISSITLEWNHGFRTHELREIAAILNDNQQKIIDTWNEHLRRKSAS
jgi:uncharacterized protein DUF4160